MNVMELQEALRNKRPVVLDARKNVAVLRELEYKCVSAIIQRIDDAGETHIFAELEDKCGHSVTVCRAENVRYMIRRVKDEN